MVDRIEIKIRDRVTGDEKTIRAGFLIMAAREEIQNITRVFVLGEAEEREVADTLSMLWRAKKEIFKTNPDVEGVFHERKDAVQEQVTVKNESHPGTKSDGESIFG